jgi:hypothetical protein
MLLAGATRGLSRPGPLGGKGMSSRWPWRGRYWWPWRGRYWPEYVYARAGVVRQQLESLYARVPDNERPAKQHLHAAISHQLRLACHETDAPMHEHEGARETPSSDAKRRAKGTIDAAFLHLHAAELMLVELLPTPEIEARVPYVVARLQTCMGPHARLPRMIAGQLAAQRRDMIAAQRGDMIAEECFRAVFTNATRAAYAASDEQHALLKQFRNILGAGFVVVTALVIGVSVVGWRFPAAISLCFSPTENKLVCPAGDNGPFGGDVALVPLMGLLGGALSAAIALRNMRGSPPPYAISVGLSILKLPTGALTAVVGLLLVHGEFIPGLSNLDTSGQILAYAVVFGFAQQIATQFVDRRAREVLSTVPGRESLITPAQDGHRTATDDGQSAGMTWYSSSRPGRRRRGRRDDPERHDDAAEGTLGDQSNSTNTSSTSA